MPRRVSDRVDCGSREEHAEPHNNRHDWTAHEGRLFDEAVHLLDGEVCGKSLLPVLGTL